MVKKIEFLTFILFLTLPHSLCQAKDYPYRWVYVSRSLHKDTDVNGIRSIVKTASEHGLNGMVLAAGLDRLDRQPAHYFERLKLVKQICEKHNIEIIPIIFSVGYVGRRLKYPRGRAHQCPRANRNTRNGQERGNRKDLQRRPRSCRDKRLEFELQIRP